MSSSLLLWKTTSGVYSPLYQKTSRCSLEIFKSIFIGKVVFICLVGSFNSVLKFLGQPGETRFQPGGMKFHRGSPWLSILSWLNLQANKDYVSYEYTLEYKQYLQVFSCERQDLVYTSSRFTKWTLFIYTSLLYMLLNTLQRKSFSPKRCSLQLDVVSVATSFKRCSLGVVSCERQDRVYSFLFPQRRYLEYTLLLWKTRSSV